MDSNIGRAVIRVNMDPRLLDIISAIASIAILIVMLLGLPYVMEPAFAYIAAIIIFILAMSGAGLYINRTIT